MSDIYSKKKQSITKLINSYEQYNGIPAKVDYESIKRYFIHFLANSRKIFIKFDEDIDEKFKALEDLE